MKVLVVGPISSPIIQRLRENLSSIGVDVVVASHNANDIDGVIDLGKLKSIFSYFDFIKIRKLVKRINPDIVHAHIVNHYGLMCLFSQKPTVVSLWGSDVILAPYQKSILHRSFYRIINWIVLKAATRCHTSSYHVAKEAEKQAKGSLKKIDVFYWGFPLKNPTEKRLEQIKNALRKEFLIEGGGYITFPRGLSEVYNPQCVAKIVNKITSDDRISNKIVVLKGFANDNAEKQFLEQVESSKIIYVNRILSAEELYYLYSKTDIHISVPKSDSLGGGVIEPALLGSFPVLSNLPPYIEYKRRNPAYILEDCSDKALERLIAEIIHNRVARISNIAPSYYSLSSVMSGLMATYSKALGKHVDVA